MASTQSPSRRGKKPGRFAPDSLDYVSLEPFREAFAQSGMSVLAVARRAGLDREQTARMLQGKPGYSTKTLADGTKRRCVTVSQRVSYAHGVRLCRALDLHPVDCGV